MCDVGRQNEWFSFKYLSDKNLNSCVHVNHSIGKNQKILNYYDKQLGILFFVRKSPTQVWYAFTVLFNVRIDYYYVY